MEPSSPLQLFALLGAALLFGLATGLIHTPGGAEKNPVPGAGTVVEVLQALRRAPVPLAIIATLATLCVLIVAAALNSAWLAVAGAIYGVTAMLSLGRIWILKWPDRAPLDVPAEAIRYGLRNFDRVDADRDGLILASDLEWHRRTVKLGTDEARMVNFLAANIDKIGRLLGSHVAAETEHHWRYRQAPAITHVYAIARGDLASYPV